MEYDQTNKGALWKVQDDYKVVRQGKINMNGNDRRVIAVSRKNAQGKPIISLYEEIANIAPHEGEAQNSPSAKGVIDIRKADTTKSIGVWKKLKKDGEEFWSVSLSDYTPRNEETNDTTTNDLDNSALNQEKVSVSDYDSDEIPF